jgi:hypothetical protein
MKTDKPFLDRMKRAVEQAGEDLKWAKVYRKSGFHIACFLLSKLDKALKAFHAKGR